MPPKSQNPAAVTVFDYHAIPTANLQIIEAYLRLRHRHAASLGATTPDAAVSEYWDNVAEIFYSDLALVTTLLSEREDVVALPVAG